MWEPRRLTTLWASTACYRVIAFTPRSFPSFSQIDFIVAKIDGRLSFHLLLRLTNGFFLPNFPTKINMYFSSHQFVVHVPSISFSLLLFCLDGLSSLACGHSELILKLRILQTVGRTPWTGDQPVARPLHTQDSTNNKLRHPCLDWYSNPRSQSFSW
jgi:hypothetical protein